MLRENVDKRGSVWTGKRGSVCAETRGSVCSEMEGSIWAEYPSNSQNRIAKTTEIVQIGLIIHPNPAKESITLNLENKEDVLKLITIYDITGRVINTLNFNGKGPVTIPIKELESGLYKVEVLSSNNNRTHSTFVKQ